RHTHQDIVRAIEIALRDPARVHPARRMLPRHIKHFKVPTRIDFSTSPDGSRTRLSLVCTDQPGLLAKVAAILRTQHMRVHDARIATFGERVEDFFLISDEQDRAIADEHILEQLQTHLITCVEGDIHAKH
ncbi:MAG: ACT domain-containing protein, partial [Methylococcales bacterium]